MSNKRINRDSRVEPLPAGTPVDSVTNYRVDRVFAPLPRTRTQSQAAVPDPASEAANALLATRRAKKTLPPSPATVPPASGAPAPALTTPIGSSEIPVTGDAEVELSLRRQLSRLQRQLAEAQRELANKDDELAAEVEKRLVDQATLAKLTEDHLLLQERVAELEAFETRTHGIDQRLQDSLAAYDELAQRCDRERELTAAATARVDELTRAFDETRALWNAERTMLEERTAAERLELEAQKKSAREEAEAAIATATARLRETHEQELTYLREAHERSLAALRGELEPQVLAARELVEDKERLANELAAAKADAARTLAAREEAHARALEKLTEAHQAEVATLTRAAEADRTKLVAERDLHVLGLQQQIRGSEAREQSLDQTVATLRESELDLKRQLAEAREKASQLEADLGSVEARLALATRSVETTLADKRAVEAQLATVETEARRNAMDRLRFVAYLEEGLAMLGALPPAITIEADEPPDPAAPPEPPAA